MEFIIINREFCIISNFLDAFVICVFCFRIKDNHSGGSQDSMREVFDLLSQPKCFPSYDLHCIELIVIVSAASPKLVNGLMRISGDQNILTCLLYTSPSPRDGLLS